MQLAKHINNSRTKHREQRESQRGFSLIEVLASTVLLLLLLGAVVFNVTALGAHAELDEGVTRFESLLRFVRAEAARTGHRVRLDIVPSEMSGERPLHGYRVLMEESPLAKPGYFSAIQAATWMPEGIDELVGIESVGTLDDFFPRPDEDPVDEFEPKENGVVDLDRLLGDDDGFNLDLPMDPMDVGESIASFHFYPDGSCDAIDLVFVSRNLDDRRRIRVRVLEVTGSILIGETDREYDRVSDAEPRTTELTDY